MVRSAIVDSTGSIRQITRYGAIWAEPIELVKDGPWAGVWADTRVWHESDTKPKCCVIGYVRIVPDNPSGMYVALRVQYDDSPYFTRLYVKNDVSGMGLIAQLRRSCELLLLAHVAHRMTDLPECESMSEFGTKCTSSCLHVLDEPMHVDEVGHVWCE